MTTMTILTIGHANRKSVKYDLNISAGRTGPSRDIFDQSSYSKSVHQGLEG